MSVKTVGVVGAGTTSREAQRPEEDRTLVPVRAGETVLVEHLTPTQIVMYVGVTGDLAVANLATKLSETLSKRTTSDAVRICDRSPHSARKSTVKLRVTTRQPTTCAAAFARPKPGIRYGT